MELDELRTEITRLRDWRHDTAPALEALERLVPELSREVARLRRQVSAIAEEDRFAVRLERDRAQRRRRALTFGDKVLVTLLALPGLINLTLRLFGIEGL